MAINHMKILHLNTWDSVGGAARAAYRLHQGLIQIDVESNIFVQGKMTNDDTIIGPATKYQKALAVIRPHIERLPLVFYPSNQKALFHFQWLPNNVPSKIKRLNPDIIHMHWICGGFIPVEAVARFADIPIVWTLHDMWPLTGGCHLTGGCERFKENCGSCPQLGGKKRKDLTYWTWMRKSRAWKNLNITFISPSSWLADCTKNSRLLGKYDIHVIPNGLDVERFRRIDQRVAREILCLDPGKKYMLFGAINAVSDKNKGFQYLLEVVEFIGRACPEKVELLLFGEPESIYRRFDFGIKVNYINRLYDDISLSLLYAASDVLVVPSIQESFGQTASEAMACGTPVVAFNVTGLKDIVDNGENGYLIPPFDSEAMAGRICDIMFFNGEEIERMRSNARKKAESRFDRLKIAHQHCQLYDKVLK